MRNQAQQQSCYSSCRWKERMSANRSTSKATIGGYARPTISSVRHSYSSFSGIEAEIGLQADCFGVKPALQLIRKKEPLISTKLCETIHGSTGGHVFELSSSQESYPSLEYNSLHDPHLKSYFHQSQMKKKLIKNEFVTPDLYVVCHSLREYNAYCKFLESEFVKLYGAREDMVIEKKKMEKSIKTETHHTRLKNAYRKEKRKQFFKQQEIKLRLKEADLQKRKKQEHEAKIKIQEEHQMRRERNKIKREAEQEQRKLGQLRKEYEEANRRKSLLLQCDAEERMRQVKLTQKRKAEKTKHLKELEKRWQKYEEHAQQVKEEEQAERAREKEEREKRIQKRKKNFQLLRKRDEEHQEKFHKENYRQAEQLKKQADHLEKKRKKMKDDEVYKWKQIIQKKRENWEHYVMQQKEAKEKGHKKHLEELKHTHLPSVTSNVNHEKHSTLKLVSKVRFTPKPTVHIIKNHLSKESSLDGVCQVVEIEEDLGVSTNDKAELPDLDHKDSIDQDLHLIEIEEDLEAYLSDNNQVSTNDEAELPDLDHKDSFDLHLEKSQEWGISNGNKMGDCNKLKDDN